ncbi:acetamidase/formamidase family protein [Saccharopolyspora mangrovi]|uniref:Acetamidase/formamidase family protein n=1 Tax=Saccharopolyspora mangrovi TaxID=3082379 RepID=A0ABU6A6K5_9PSEU|nr:acetamidase/formamidase family protein [Saccharopolyspora sp. S2-29]MEB3367193.1 acetamidase/formamidase family protein [Saccharopolyspora sp. S2-29]
MGSVVDVFSRDVAPALTVDAGDVVTVESLDCSGHLERQRVPGEQRPLMFTERRGHCLTGPIAVRGAKPGMVLAVHFEELTPAEWGWTATAGKDNWLLRRLRVADAGRSWLLWELDGGTGTNQHGHTVPLAPFLGVVGMPPEEPGEHSTIPPRPEGGGNIDCRELVAGSTLYLPVTVPDAMLLLGDGHARQGDGEVGGTAIECGMTSRVRLDLIVDRPVPGIHAETPAGLVTFGFDADLNEATATALSAMVDWLQIEQALERGPALALASATVDMRITQIANETWGVHAVLPTGVLG